MDDLAGQLSRVQSLEVGKGLQFLINEAYSILGNPLILFNMEYELLAHSENAVSDDRFWTEIVQTGVFCDESILFFMEECFIDAVASTNSVTTLISDKLKYDRYYGRVFGKYNNTVADLIMIASNRPLVDHDAILFEAVCGKLSQEISISEFFTNYGILYEESLICKLLDTNLGDKVINAGHLSNLYEGLKSNLYVIVIDIGKSDDASNDLENLRDMFKEMQPELKYAVYSNYIVVVASTDESALDHNNDLRVLSEYFKENKLRIGQSCSFDNLFNLREYYNGAVDSLTGGQQPRDAQ